MPPQPPSRGSRRISCASRSIRARSKIEGFRATPGMPADVYIKTGERMFAEYLLRPLLDSLSRGFREP